MNITDILFTVSIVLFLGLMTVIYFARRASRISYRAMKKPNIKDLYGAFAIVMFAPLIPSVWLRYVKPDPNLDIPVMAIFLNIGVIVLFTVLSIYNKFFRKRRNKNVD